MVEAKEAQKVIEVIVPAKVRKKFPDPIRKELKRVYDL